MRMRYSLLSVGVSAFVLAGPAMGQTSIDRYQRQLDQIQRESRLRINPDVPAGQRAYFDYGAYINLQYLSIQDMEDHYHHLREYDLIGWGHLNLDGAHDFVLRARTSYLDFNPGESFDGEGDETVWPTIELAYYRFDLAKYKAAYKGESDNGNIVATIGRQYITWANGLVLSQYMDGGTIDFSYGNVDLLTMAARTSHKTVDFDSSRPQFDDYTNRYFFGGMLSAQVGKHRPYVYGLVQHDDNRAGTGDLVTGPITTEFDYNSFYIGTGVNGAITDRLLYGAELVYEGGKGLSNSFDASSGTPMGIPQEEEPIEAGAADFRLDYVPGDAHRSRLVYETILATGDSDRTSSTNTFGGNQPGTADHSFNAWGLLNTGLAFSPSVSNIAIFRLGGSTFPFSSGAWRRMQTGTDLFLYTKFTKSAPIDEPTTDDRLLGFEPDLYLNWQITSDITLMLRYGLFVPGSAIVNNDQPRNFFFAGLTFAF